MTDTPVKLWSPDAVGVTRTHMWRFLDHIKTRFPQLDVRDYSAVHRWSVEACADFWPAMLDFAQLHVTGERTPVRTQATMPKAAFFPQLQINLAENLLRGDDAATAVISVSETRAPRRTSYGTLRAHVARVRDALQGWGIQAGDVVAGFVPNTEEALVAMLATASLGAIWTSCSPDFGIQGVVDRFGQTRPRVLFAANATMYNGKTFACGDKIAAIATAITTIERVVVIEHVEKISNAALNTLAFVSTWQDILAADSASSLAFLRQPFNTAAYILYSSGTTGAPKCIVHGIGGTLLQHAKELLLHTDLHPGDNLLYFTTCGWMMWNWMVSGLLTGACITLFDGSPTFPTHERLWQVIQDERVTHFGTSPKFLGSCRGKVEPDKDFYLQQLRVVLSTGAPLLPQDFDWVYEHVKQDVQLSSISGGTDIISCFVLGNPTLPVYRGEIQCFGLGMDVAVFDSHDEAVIGQKGELVCRSPFPSAPVSFWSDPEGKRYRESYFRQKGGVWYHGDYIAVTGSQGSAGGIVVYGRSDATLNPGGVRIGTAEIYRLVETVEGVEDSIVIGQPWQGDVRVILFVKLGLGQPWSPALAGTIKSTIRAGATPRHVPALIIPVDKIPYTISGKKVELAVLQVVTGVEPKNREALVDPSALDCYRDLPDLIRIPI